MATAMSQMDDDGDGGQRRQRRWRCHGWTTTVMSDGDGDGDDADGQRRRWRTATATAMTRMDDVLLPAGKGYGCVMWLNKFVKCVRFLELYTTVLPAVFLVLVFCWYQICWMSPQKGGHCPPFEEKGGHCPLFDAEMYRRDRVFLRYVWYW